MKPLSEAAVTAADPRQASGTAPLPPPIWDAAYAELRQRLVRIVARAAPSSLQDQADDLVQQALLRILRAAPRDGLRGLSDAYLWRVAGSVTIDEVRRRRCRPAEQLDDNVEPTVDGATPEHRLASRELGLGIRACLATLTPPRRTAVVLHLQGHTVPEVARLAGWTPKKAENLVYRGLHDLRRALAAKGLSPTTRSPHPRPPLPALMRAALSDKRAAWSV